MLKIVVDFVDVVHVFPDNSQPVLKGLDTSNMSEHKTSSTKSIPQISIADFQQMNSLKDAPDSKFLLTLEELSNNLPFIIKDLRDLPEGSTQFMLADCFAKKGALEQYCPGYTTQDFLRYIERVWPKLQDLSFGLVDSSGTLVGVATMADEMDLLDISEIASRDIHPHLTNVYTYLDSLVERVNDRLPQERERGSYYSS